MFEETGPLAGNKLLANVLLKTIQMELAVACSWLAKHGYDLVELFSENEVNV